MLITIMLYDKKPFASVPRAFNTFEYSSTRVDAILNHFKDIDADVYIYSGRVDIDSYKRYKPIASQIRRTQGYLVCNTAAWRRFYESNH